MHLYVTVVNKVGRTYPLLIKYPCIGSCAIILERKLQISADRMPEHIILP